MGLEKGLRAWHESKMHENSIFLTLTYSPEHLESPFLIYRHWQTFIKDLRDRVGYLPEERISVMVTGEYGEENKRPHWHALLFNYCPHDQKKLRKTERGDQVFESHFLTDLWSKGNVEYGAVTLESARYVASYALKKLVHGKDQDHRYHPLHKTSSKNAIGKSWIEKYWKHTFENGFVVLADGSEGNIPRYYEDWFKKQMPNQYIRYVTEVKPKRIREAERIARAEELEFLTAVLNRKNLAPYPLTRSKVKQTILNRKFQQLQEHLKL